MVAVRKHCSASCKRLGISSNAPKKDIVGRILWFRVDRFSVPCPRVIVIPALPEDMPHLSENDAPMNVPFSFGGEFLRPEAGEFDNSKILTYLSSWDRTPTRLRRFLLSQTDR